jgi:hypothetical protein
MPVFFFLLPVYGVSYGEAVESKATMLWILSDWYDLKGTQTEPPPALKPVLYLVLGLSTISDIVFIILNRDPESSNNLKSKTSAWLQVARVFGLAAAIGAAVCGELTLEHVASNTLPPSESESKTAVFGSMISVLMILLIVPPGYELLAVLDRKTPRGD